MAQSSMTASLSIGSAGGTRRSIARVEGFTGFCGVVPVRWTRRAADRRGSSGCLVRMALRALSSSLRMRPRSSLVSMIRRVSLARGSG